MNTKTIARSPRSEYDAHKALTSTNTPAKPTASYWDHVQTTTRSTRK